MSNRRNFRQLNVSISVEKGCRCWLNYLYHPEFMSHGRGAGQDNVLIATQLRFLLHNSETAAGLMAAAMMVVRSHVYCHYSSSAAKNPNRECGIFP